MRPFVCRNTYFRWFLLILTVCGLVMPSLASAQFDDIAALEREREFFTLQCRIMEVHPDHLVVCEETIKLVDFRQGGKRYKTMLRDHKGRSISYQSFKKGQWVFIRGFELSNGHWGAREIYRLHRELRSWEGRNYPFLVTAATWEAER